MNDAAFPLDGDAMRLLADIGFLATDTGQHDAARKLFEQLLVLRPGKNLPYIGLALAHMGANRPAEALRILRDEGLRRLPGDAEITAFVGMALFCANRVDEAKSLLTALVDAHGGPDGNDANGEAHIRMAKKLLATGAQGSQAAARATSNPASIMPRWSEQARRAGDAQVPSIPVPLTR